MKAIAFLVSALLAALPVTADEPEFDWSLRAGTQPDLPDRAWDQGAMISYQDVNGKSSTQLDADLKAGYKWFVPRDGRDFTSGSTLFNLSPGAYIHKDSGSPNPQNDRGGSLNATAHIIPGGSAAGAVIHYDLGATIKAGRSLKRGTGDRAGESFDVDSKRGIMRAVLYFQPSEGEFVPNAARTMVYFFKVGTSLYSDEITGAQVAVINGRVTGVAGYVQFSIYPLGLDPTKNRLGALGFAPMITLQGQSQHDFSASQARSKDNRSLYSTVLSIPFASADKDYKGVVPSLEIQRSVGADILVGRDYRRETRIALSIKF